MVLFFGEVAECLGLFFGQAGYPIVKNYSPKDYFSKTDTSSPQNFGIIQHASGLILVGNTTGVMAFDGNVWEMVGGTENLQLFKFAKDWDGKIYTGGIREIGIIDADSSEKLIFKSLKHELSDSARDFQQIYRVVASKDAVFFLGGTYLFSLDASGFEVHLHNSSLRRVFATSLGVFVTDEHALFLY